MRTAYEPAISARATARYSAPTPAPGATALPPGKAEDAPRNAVCTPSIRVIGEKRPNHWTASVAPVSNAIAWMVETAP